MKDPAAAIPKGTLGAIALTYVTYSYFAIQTGFIFKPRASGVKVEYQAENYEDFYDKHPEINLIIKDFGIERLPYIDECENVTNVLRDNLKKAFEAQNLTDYRLWGIGKGCEHGSALDQMTMTYTSFTGYLR